MDLELRRTFFRAIKDREIPTVSRLFRNEVRDLNLNPVDLNNLLSDAIIESSSVGDLTMVQYFSSLRIYHTSYQRAITLAIRRGDLIGFDIVKYLIRLNPPNSSEFADILKVAWEEGPERSEIIELLDRERWGR
jgi:hypothetical protein